MCRVGMVVKFKVFGGLVSNTDVRHLEYKINISAFYISYFPCNFKVHYENIKKTISLMPVAASKNCVLLPFAHLHVTLS
jgi:hypothetical protein